MVYDHFTVALAVSRVHRFVSNHLMAFSGSVRWLNGENDESSSRRTIERTPKNSVGCRIFSGLRSGGHFRSDLCGLYYALSGEWSLSATLLGFAGPLIIVAVGIQLAWRMPIEQLTSLETRRV